MKKEDAIYTTKKYMAEALGDTMSALVNAIHTEYDVTRDELISIMKSRASNFVWHLDYLLQLRLNQSEDDLT